LDALSKQREARLALMSDKLLEQKFMEIQEQVDRMKLREAELVEQQNALNDTVALYENMNLQLEEQKKSLVSLILSFSMLHQILLELLRLLSALRFCQHC
jgi:hypothetical protein